jgi:hypothetical protein
MRGSPVVAAAVAPLTLLLAATHRMRLRGRALDWLKWIPADHAYGRGLADALRGTSDRPRGVE